MTTITESDVEQAALEWLEVLGWQTAYGPDIGPGGLRPERGRLRPSSSRTAFARHTR